ncbi:MAG: polynucleotide adenylyltransferase, partial [Anaerolineae bacterium]
MELTERLIGWLARQEEPVYLVGGAMRDRLLGRPLYDLDVAVDGDGRALARRLANHFGGAYYTLDEERSVGRAILDETPACRLVVDVARLRGADLAADLADRDWTINAMAAPAGDPGAVVDLHGGQADLAARVIRPVSDGTIRNDPLRALRAMRQAAELDFRLSRETEALLRRDGPQLVEVPGERVRDELARLLVRPTAAGWLQRLDQLGLLAVIFPELEAARGETQPEPHHLDVLAHS